jgi:hypothetical protein
MDLRMRIRSGLIEVKTSRRWGDHVDGIYSGSTKQKSKMGMEREDLV